MALTTWVVAARKAVHAMHWAIDLRCRVCLQLFNPATICRLFDILVYPF